jgi:uncharacterized protein
MGGQATWARLPDGKRLHFHHGPIDIITEAFGDPMECEQAYQQGFECFRNLLAELVSEVDLLRTNASDIIREPEGTVARNMYQNVSRFNPQYITPMAAVAGAVADHVLNVMTAGRDLSKAYVNNGGDIAIYLNEGEFFSTAIVDNPDHPSMDGNIRIEYDGAARGMATSGWRGRSQSLGIADAVTVLGDTAAIADAAATLIANAVTVKHPSVETKVACDLRDDTDLGIQQVTVNVDELPDWAVEEALANGQEKASEYMTCGLITAAYISLQNQRRIIGAENTILMNRRQA